MSKFNIDFFMSATTTWKEIMLKNFNAALAEEGKDVPVAWMDREGDIYPMPEIEGWAPPHTMLYTQPPQREPLTNEEVDALINSVDSLGIGRHVMHKVARAIERAHGIGGEG